MRILHKLKTMSLWHFVWISIVFTSIMSVILRGKITYDYLITGAVVALIVSSIVIYFIKQMRESEKRAEEEIKRLRDFSESVVNNAPVGIFTIDREGRITSANPAHKKMMGWKTPEQGIGLNVFEMPTIRERGYDAYFKKVLQGERIELSDLEYTSIFGKTVHISVRASPMKNEKDEVEGAVILLEDVTEEKHARQQIAEHAKSLKEKAMELEKANRNLEETRASLLLMLEDINELNAQLEHSNRLKDLFTDIMTHDLINPAGVIMNMADLRLEKSSGEEKEALQLVKRNAEKLIDMITNAGKYAKLESAEKLDFESIDLNVLFKDVAQNFEHLLKEKRIKLEHIPSGECIVEANPMIEDVFLNLISNAIRYSPEGSRIVVGIEDDNDSWRVMVKDYGYGIEDEYKQKIFDRFTRIEKGGVRGTGLGLTIVKKIVELHNGRVWVEDNPKGGSIFCVELPKKKKAKSA